MYSPLLLSVLGASRDGEDVGWMQLLVFVAVGAIYAINAVLKARANKRDQSEEEGLVGKRTRRPLAGAGRVLKQAAQGVRRPATQEPRARYRPQVRPARPRVVRPEVGGKPGAALEGLPVEVGKTQPAVSIQRPERLLREAPWKETKEPIEAAAEGAEAGYVFEIPSASEDPDELRRAILYYETLGKPVSLREPLQ